MADDKILVPFGIDQDGFKGDIDDLLKYLQSQAGKSLDGIGREIGKKGKSVIKQILIPMADGTISSVLATSTAKNKLSRGKGRIKVAGGFVEEQIGRLQSATSVKDYDDVIKKAKKEAVYLRQISAISKRFEKAGGDVSGLTKGCNYLPQFSELFWYYCLSSSSTLDFHRTDNTVENNKIIISTIY